MRLLHTKYFRWIETFENVPPYAILSHRWLKPSEEVSFQDLQRMQAPDNEGTSNAHTFPEDVCQKAGFMKLKGACDRALQDGLDGIWIDTCCIDKTSSVELSEAINSMYAWYRNSTVCYVYLHDVGHYGQDDLVSALRGAEWFKRGWTLQELLAPDNIYFFANDWSRIGSKATWASVLHKITHIRKEILLGTPCEPSIAERMSWAAGRKTQRIEDRAYSLMGIFDIHMPIIYGEGEKAFRRLQLEIMKSSDDQTIFAWRNLLDFPHPSTMHSSLASWPDAFWSNSPYPLVHVNIHDWLSVHHLLHPTGWRSLFPSRSQLGIEDIEDGYAIQSDGIHITLPMKQDGDSWLAVLSCKTADQELPYGIYLYNIPGSNSFLRTAPTQLRRLGQRDLEGLALKKIRMVIDHHVLPSSPSPRREFFTVRSTNLNWDRCCYFICPNLDGHAGPGSTGQAIRPGTQIELENNRQCSCIYFQLENQHEMAILLIGIEDHRPWIYLLTNSDLCHLINPLVPWPANSYPIYSHQLTSEPSSINADPTSSLSSTRFAWVGPQAGNRRNAMSCRPHHDDVPCPVCAIIRRGGVNIRDIKDNRADILTETGIEVVIWKGRAGTFGMKPDLEVEYVITIS